MDILVDFDGTCTTHDFPKVGKDIGAQVVLKKLVARGHNLILFTMRSNKQKKRGKVTAGASGPFLDEAVNWFKKNDIPLYGIQSNPSQHDWTDSPKAYGQLIIDDIGLGIPLKIDKKLSKSVFVDWEGVEKLLKQNRIL